MKSFSPIWLIFDIHMLLRPTRNLQLEILGFQHFPPVFRHLLYIQFSQHQIRKMKSFSPIWLIFDIHMLLRPTSNLQVQILGFQHFPPVFRHLLYIHFSQHQIQKMKSFSPIWLIFDIRMLLRPTSNLHLEILGFYHFPPVFWPLFYIQIFHHQIRKMKVSVRFG